MIMPLTPFPGLDTSAPFLMVDYSPQLSGDPKSGLVDYRIRPESPDQLSDLLPGSISGRTRTLLPGKSRWLPEDSENYERGIFMKQGSCRQYLLSDSACTAIFPHFPRHRLKLIR